MSNCAVCYLTLLVPCVCVYMCTCVCARFWVLCRLVRMHLGCVMIWLLRSRACVCVCVLILFGKQWRRLLVPCTVPSFPELAPLDLVPSKLASNFNGIRTQFLLGINLTPTVCFAIVSSWHTPIAHRYLSSIRVSVSLAARLLLLFEPCGQIRHLQGKAMARFRAES